MGFLNHQQFRPFPSKHSPVENLVIFPLSPFFHQLAPQLGFIVSHLVGPVTKCANFYQKNKDGIGNGWFYMDFMWFYPIFCWEVVRWHMNLYIVVKWRCSSNNWNKSSRFLSSWIARPLWQVRLGQDNNVAEGHQEVAFPLGLATLKDFQKPQNQSAPVTTFLERLGFPTHSIVYKGAGSHWINMYIYIYMYTCVCLPPANKTICKFGHVDRYIYE